MSLLWWFGEQTQDRLIIPVFISQFCLWTPLATIMKCQENTRKNWIHGIGKIPNFDWVTDWFIYLFSHLTEPSLDIYYVPRTVLGSGDANEQAVTQGICSLLRKTTHYKVIAHTMLMSQFADISSACDSADFTERATFWVRASKHDQVPFFFFNFYYNCLPVFSEFANW